MCDDKQINTVTVVSPTMDARFSGDSLTLGYCLKEDCLDYLAFYYVIVCDCAKILKKYWKYIYTSEHWSRTLYDVEPKSDLVD